MTRFEQAAIDALIRELLPEHLYATVPTAEQYVETCIALGMKKGAAWIRNWASDVDVARAKEQLAERAKRSGHLVTCESISGSMVLPAFVSVETGKCTHCGGQITVPKTP